MHPNFSSAVSHRFAMAAGVSRPNSGIATSSTGRDRTEMKGILTERQQICLVAVLSARKAVSQKEWIKHRLTREHHPLLPVRSFFTHLDINRITHVLRLTRKKQRQKFCPHTDGLQGTTYPHLRCCEADSGGWTGGCRLVKEWGAAAAVGGPRRQQRLMKPLCALSGIHRASQCPPPPCVHISASASLSGQGRAASVSSHRLPGSLHTTLSNIWCISPRFFFLHILERELMFSYQREQNTCTAAHFSPWNLTSGRRCCVIRSGDSRHTHMFLPLWSIYYDFQIKFPLNRGASRDTPVCLD